MYGSIVWRIGVRLQLDYLVHSKSLHLKSMTSRIEFRGPFAGITKELGLSYHTYGDSGWIELRPPSQLIQLWGGKSGLTIFLSSSLSTCMHRVLLRSSQTAPPSVGRLGGKL